MTTFTCPGCGASMDAIASSAGHRCPNRRNRYTEWVPEEMKDLAVPQTAALTREAVYPDDHHQ